MTSVAEDAKVGAHGAAMPFGSSGPTVERKEEVVSTATQQTNETTATNKRQAAEAAELRKNTERAALRIAARKGKIVNAVPKPKDAAKGKQGAKDERARAPKPVEQSQPEQSVPTPASDAPKVETKERPGVLRVNGTLYYGRTVEEKTAICKLALDTLGKLYPGAGMASKALRDAGKAEWVTVDDDGTVTIKANGNGKPKRERAPREPKARKDAKPRDGESQAEWRAALKVYRSILADIRAGKLTGKPTAHMDAATLANYQAYRAWVGSGGGEKRERKAKGETVKQPTKADILAIVNDAANDAMTVAELRARLFPVAQPEGEQSGDAPASN